MVRVGFFNSVHIPCHVAHIQTFIVIHHFCGSCAIPSPLATAFIMTGAVNIYRVIVQEDDWGGGFFFFSLFFFYFLFLPFIFIFFKQDWRVKKSFLEVVRKHPKKYARNRKKKRKKKLFVWAMLILWYQILCRKGSSILLHQVCELFCGSTWYMIHDFCGSTWFKTLPMNFIYFYGILLIFMW